MARLSSARAMSIVNACQDLSHCTVPYMPYTTRTTRIRLALRFIVPIPYLGRFFNERN